MKRVAAASGLWDGWARSGTTVTPHPFFSTLVLGVLGSGPVDKVSRSLRVGHHGMGRMMRQSYPPMIVDMLSVGIHRSKGVIHRW